jgi:hypothetical protein
VKFDNPEGNSLRLVSNKFDHTLKGFLPQKEFYWMNDNQAFYNIDNDNNYFIYPYSNIIYHLNHEEVKSYLQIDFGNKTLPYSKIKNFTQSQELEILCSENEYIGDISEFCVSGDKFYFSFREMKKNAQKYSACVDINTLDVQVFRGYVPFKPISSKLPFKSLSFTNPICTYKDYLIYQINPSDLSNEDLRKVELDEESNPLLFFVKHK